MGFGTAWKAFWQLLTGGERAEALLRALEGKELPTARPADDEAKPPAKEEPEPADVF